jgi:hypothetical protein
MGFAGGGDMFSCQNLHKRIGNLFAMALKQLKNIMQDFYCLGDHRDPNIFSKQSKC